MAGPRISIRAFGLHAGVAFLWFLLLVFCYRNLFDDPSSYFFNPKSGPRLRILNTRNVQVSHYLEQISLRDGRDDLESEKTRKPDLRRWPKRLCLGIFSDPRNPNHDALSLAHTLASLRRELTSSDRESMHVTILLATDSPIDHFAFQTPWLPKLVDEILFYGSISQGNTTRAGSKAYREQDFDTIDGVPVRGVSSVNGARRQHSVLLDVCQETQASYVALVGPDFVATDDWHPRLLSALTQANKVARVSGRDWAYIKLFYQPSREWSPTNHNWLSKSELWALGYVIAVLAGVGFFRWGLYRRRMTAKTLWQESIVLLSLVVWVPVFVRLLVLAGGMRTFQLHFWPYVGGVREMTWEVCCEKGVVFQGKHVEELRDMLANLPYDLRLGEILDQLAEKRGLWRWMMDPAITL